ncbi:phosphatase, partial [Streptomyces venezuelae]|uniref:phosphatase n=1 Tax=Streptomyces venezuelae TaxID=54571 RepID=UPI001F249136
DGLGEDGRPARPAVVGDHQVRAGQRGIDSVGYADCNDPALFIGEAEGTMQVTIPLDDHVLDPRFYEPLTAYTLNAAGLA